jgi:hypothetical protein
MPLSLTTRTLAIVVAVTLGGCSFSPEKKGGAGGYGNNGVGGHPDLQGIGGSGNLSTGGTGNEAQLDGGNCGVLDRPLVMLPPDVLIVLDRSGSMDNDITDKGCSTMDGGVGMTTGNCGLNSKWGIMTPAIKSVVSATENDVNWGLKFFANAGDSACGVDTRAAVNIAAMNATNVNNAIMMQTNTAGGISGGSRTPTRAAITNASTYLRGLTDPNPKFILLATDGQPNCPANGNTGNDDSPAAIAAVQTAYQNGIPTFVVGIATTGMGMADATLTSMAMAGGYPQAGSPAYYSVDSQQALTDALNAIVTKVGGSCLFALGATPTNNGSTSHDKISVFADGNMVTKDTTHAGGWDYSDPSHNSIQLYGQLCQDVMSGQVKVVNVVYQCIIG